MAKTTTIAQMNTAIANILNEYSNEVSTNMDIVVKKVCANGAKTLRSQSASTFKGNKYKKSWTYSVEKTRLYSKGAIYSKMPGLPHLLEYGHVVRTGGRVVGKASAHVHIEPVAENLVTEFEREVKRYL